MNIFALLAASNFELNDVRETLKVAITGAAELRKGNQIVYSKIVNIILPKKGKTNREETPTRHESTFLLLYIAHCTSTPQNRDLFYPHTHNKLAIHI